MTATATAEAVAEAPPAKKGKRKLILVVLVVLVVLGAGGAAAAMLLGGGDDDEAGEEVEPEVVEGEVAAVAEMTANLAGPQTRYAKVAFSAVLVEGATPALVEGRFPLLRDAAITELSAFSADHLRTTAGMDELRARLGARAQELYPDGEVVRIVFTELVVQ